LLGFFLISSKSQERTVVFPDHPAASRRAEDSGLPGGMTGFWRRRNKPWAGSPLEKKKVSAGRCVPTWQRSVSCRVCTARQSLAGFQLPTAKLGQHLAVGDHLPNRNSDSEPSHAANRSAP